MDDKLSIDVLSDLTMKPTETTRELLNRPTRMMAVVNDSYATFFCKGLT
jgi:hypothetical protein